MQHKDMSMLRVRCVYCEYIAKNPLSDQGLDLGEHLAIAHKLKFDGQSLLACGVDPVAILMAERIISGEVEPF